MHPTRLAYIIRTLRHQHGLTQSQVANVAGCTYLTILHIEHGRYGNLSMATFNGIAEAFEMKGWQLLKIIEEPNPSIPISFVKETSNAILHRTDFRSQLLPAVQE